MKSMKELREDLAGAVADELKKGNALWHQNISSMPQSLISERTFGGINALYLMQDAVEKGFTDSRWIPRPGEQKDVDPSKKILIKKGEKGTHIEHWGHNKDGDLDFRTVHILIFNSCKIPRRNPCLRQILRWLMAF